MGADGDPVVRTDAHANQAMRDPVGLGVECRVAPRLLFIADGNRIRRALRLRFELAMQRLFLRINRIGCIEPVGQLPTLGLRQQRNVAHHRLAVSHHGPQYRLQIIQVALDGAVVKQRCGIFHDAAEMIRTIADAQRQVEFCECGLFIQRFELHIAQLQFQPLAAVPGQ